MHTTHQCISILGGHSDSFQIPIQILTIPNITLSEHFTPHTKNSKTQSNLPTYHEITSRA